MMHQKLKRKFNDACNQEFFFLKCILNYAKYLNISKFTNVILSYF